MVDNTREQKLIESLSIGGLTSISEDCEHLFFKTEEVFHKETAVANLRNIDIMKIRHNFDNGYFRLQYRLGNEEQSC